MADKIEDKKKEEAPKKPGFFSKLKDAAEVIEKLKEYSFLIRKILSQKVVMKFLPKLLFSKDESFEYAEKIENLIKSV